MDLYTDGACGKNKIGGWAFVVWAEDNAIFTDHGRVTDTTNNLMEMQAVIEAIQWLSIQGSVRGKIFSDSEYVVKGFNEWLPNWVIRNWKTTTGAVKNRAQWEQLLELQDSAHFSIHWVRGHYGFPGNELADKLASEAAGTRTVA